MKLVVILPTYNERENIVVLLNKLHDALKDVKGYSISYLVVDDNSPDGTRQVVETYEKNHPDVHLISGQKEGLGKALLRGMTQAFEYLGADVVLQIDADLSHDPKVAPKFLKSIDRGYNFVVGSRYMKGGGIPSNWGLHRKIYSILGNMVVRFGLGHIRIRDWTGGYRAYTKKFYDEIHTQLTKYSGYVFQIAFLHKAIHHGAKVVEVPFHFTDRLYGHSKIAPAEYIKNIILYIIESRINELFSGSFAKFLVVGGIGFILNASILVLLHNVAHMQAPVANLIGAGVAIFSNYNLNNLWTFGHNKISGASQYLIKLLQFYGTSVFGVIVIQTGTIETGVRLVGDSYYFIYFLIGTALLLIWNYVMYSKVIWKNT